MDALVLGSGACLWDDLRALGSWGDIVLAVNEAAVAYPHRLDCFVTLHPEKLPKWTEERITRGGNADFETWTGMHKQDLAQHAIGGWTNGSSGMLAVGVALEKGATRVVLCGVPMNPEPHFWDPKPWPACATHRKPWTDRLAKMQGRVFSMSGWTRELLGGPPWLDLQEAA